MLNNTILSGRLTKEPEVKFVTDEQKPVVNFTLAVERDYLDESNERKVDFIPVVAWNGIARFVSNNFGKGGLITVQGRLQSRSWDDQEGKKHYLIELHADKAYFCGNAKKNEDNLVEEPPEEYTTI